MMMICYLLAALLVLPAALLIGCAILEGSLMKNRPQLSWLLPVGAMLASALLPDGGSGLGALLWSFLAFCGRCAFFGIAAGAAIGAVMSWFSVPKDPVNPA